MMCGFPILVKAGKSYVPDIGAHLLSGSNHCFLPCECFLERREFWRCWHSLQFPKCVLKWIRFVKWNSLVTSESTWKHEAWCSERHQVVSSCWTETVERSFFSGMISLDRSTASVLSHGPYLGTFTPNYLSLHSPNIHYYFPSDAFILGISPINKNTFSLLSSNTGHPSSPRPKAIVISFPWLLQSERIYPFS